MELTRKLSLKKMKELARNAKRNWMKRHLEKLMDEGIEEGDHDKIMEANFLRDRL